MSLATLLVDSLREAASERRGSCRASRTRKVLASSGDSRRAMDFAGTNLSLISLRPAAPAALGDLMRQRFQHPLDFKARVILAPYSRAMRMHPTRSEALLWRAIRGSAVGVRFRRQVVFGNFIVDFFAPSVSLIVEVDGPVHDAQIDQDRLRDSALAARGLRVLRVSALLVESNLSAAVERIREAV